MRDINLSYDAAAGLQPTPTADPIATRPYTNWGSVLMRFADGRSNYHALETAVTKRFSRHSRGGRGVHRPLGVAQRRRSGPSAARLGVSR